MSTPATAAAAAAIQHSSVGPSSTGVTSGVQSVSGSAVNLAAVGAPTKRYHNENTVIYKELCRFEEELAQLTRSIQQYSPDPEIVSEIVMTVDKINGELEKIETLHEMRTNQIAKQTAENDSLNENLRSILGTLDECRTELDKLPKLPTAEEEELKNKGADLEKMEAEEPDLDATKQLLAYAMKLSKFSKIPRTFDGFLLPNNFVWPGDDNMRRGMLAMASMMPEKVIAAENGEEEVKMPEGATDASTVLDSNAATVSGVRANVPAAARDDTQMDIDPDGGAEEPKKQEEVMADLDLFDEDEDD